MMEPNGMSAGMIIITGKGPKHHSPTYWWVWIPFLCGWRIFCNPSCQFLERTYRRRILSTVGSASQARKGTAWLGWILSCQEVRNSGSLWGILPGASPTSHGHLVLGNRGREERAQAASVLPIKLESWGRIWLSGFLCSATRQRVSEWLQG